MAPLSQAARAILKKYDMVPHPEGGFCKETYRSETVVDTHRGERAASTAIKFMVTKDCVSRLHRIESDEVWHFYQGGPMTGKTGLTQSTPSLLLILWKRHDVLHTKSLVSFYLQ